MIGVRLTRPQLFFGAQIGVMRHMSALFDASSNGYGLDPDCDGWGLHIEGACGEQAAARSTGRWWPASNRTYKRDCDVLGFEVRTRSSHFYDLIIRPNDPDNRVFVLVTGRAPDFCVRGWIYARDGKLAEYERQHANRAAAYFVPQSALHPIETLPDHKGGD